jgi:hypothetical protein
MEGPIYRANQHGLVLDIGTMAAFDPVAEIMKEIMELRQRLTFAAEKFEKGAPDGGRSGVHITLRVLEDFLAAMFGTNDPKVFIPLRQLQYALYDLDRGKVVPLLARKKVTHRPRDSAAKEALMALAAGCMELFVEGGVARKLAARQVADALHANGHRNGPSKRITAQNVEDWRDRMRLGSPSENLAVGRFRRIAVDYRSMFPDPVTAANHILKRIPLVAPPEIPKKPPA